MLKETQLKQMNQAIEKNMQIMKEEEIVNKYVSERSKCYAKDCYELRILEQRFIQFIKNTKVGYNVRNNMKIGTYEYDVIAFSENFYGKDYVYEMKYFADSISINLEICKKQMEMLEKRFCEKFNKKPHLVLAIIVPDYAYEKIRISLDEILKNEVNDRGFSIEVIKENYLPKIQ